MDSDASETMTYLPARPSFSSAIAVLALLLGMAGCAVDPSTNSAGRLEDDKGGFTGHEKVDADPDIRSDFDAAMKHLKAGDYEKGTALLTDLTRRSPGHTASYINLAIAYQKMGNLAAAEENIKKALALNPEHPVANTEYAVLYRKTGRFGEARKLYEGTLKRHPGFLPARKNLGILCDMYLRDLECALTHYRIYSDAMPDDKAVQIWIADLEKRLGQQKQ